MFVRPVYWITWWIRWPYSSVFHLWFILAIDSASVVSCCVPQKYSQLNCIFATKANFRFNVCVWLRSSISNGGGPKTRNHEEYSAGLEAARCFLTRLAGRNIITEWWSQTRGKWKCIKLPRRCKHIHIIKWNDAFGVFLLRKCTSTGWPNCCPSKMRGALRLKWVRWRSVLSWLWSGVPPIKSGAVTPLVMTPIHLLAAASWWLSKPTQLRYRYNIHNTSNRSQLWNFAGYLFYLLNRGYCDRIVFTFLRLATLSIAKVKWRCTRRYTRSIG